MKRTRLLSVFLAVVFLVVFSRFHLAVALGDDYLYLNARGWSMYPTIRDGDRVHVRLRVSGDEIKAGPWNSSEPGDIIVYANMIYPSAAMWIGHRVIEKYHSGKCWYFKTQGDNNPAPDYWEVPEYWLLGLVVNITHVNQDTQIKHEQAFPSILLSQMWVWILGITSIIFVGLALGYYKHRKQRKAVFLYRNM